ncbi:MAG: T9SS type A sorting domain-containing protein [Bacteroidetes bacterium]|nr:T9SS type A sorting domain-containing protein [Bacteroidota bacterium]MBT3423721.1 T9SS type A sorting domain-containing protein [Bacteroidota bacterium]MBT4337009.1 T9SS type A sorting domain-containing protein [Bacteroidota bacterium]MBT4730212.1 T9SS type A sorting domain-containing protein [Bacteroidota bacterium]MBT5992175.1 T9SS type A sorting domain-containing protein [Bacteroidota bacterium]
MVNTTLFSYFDKGIKAILLILFLSAMGVFQLSAQTNSLLAGEITWFNAGHDSFIVKMDLYRDCNGDDFDSVKIDVKCESTGQLITSLHIARPNPVDITPTCATINPDQCTRCSDPTCSFPFGYERFSYSSLLDLSSTACCEIRLEYTDCCRSLDISNGGQGTDFYTYSIFNRCLPEGDNSPLFTMSSLAMIPINYEAMIYSYGNDLDMDSNGLPMDSFSYEIASPLMAGAPVVYNGLFEFSKPISFDGFPDTSLPYPQGFHVNQYLGDIHFMPRMVETAIMALKIKQFRNGQYTGEILRNFYVNFYSLPGNYTPDLNDDGIYKEVLPDSTVAFYMTTFDTDTNDIVSLIFEPAFPNSVYQTNSGETGVKWPSASVAWTPSEIYISQFPYTFKMTAKDNFCPINASVTKEFEIMVLDPSGINESSKGRFYIYPIPSKKSDVISIRGISSEFVCKIRDLQGRVLISEKISPAHNQIEYRNLAAGIYLIELVSENAIYHKKFLIR